MLRVATPFGLALLASAFLAVAEDEPVSIPRGFPPELADTLAAERPAADLGARLFRSAILSSDRSIACINCHDPGRNFARNEARSSGVHQRLSKRNVPTILNRALGARQMWDGSAATLEEQVLMPIENPDEMDLKIDDAIARLAAADEWRTEFETAFGRGPDRAALASALAAFVRAQLIGDSPVDAFRAGEYTELDDAERQGLWLFESRANCWKCHSGTNFSDEDFHATGIGAIDGKSEVGRFAVTKDESDRGRFKTPTLRGLRRTAPYMHDGSLATLDDVVEYYSRGGNPITTMDPKIEPLNLGDADKRNLLAFLEALSDSASSK